MCSGLESISKNAFFLVAEYLDGQDGVMLRRTSHAMKGLVDANENLSLKIKTRIVALESIEDLRACISTNPLVRIIDQEDMWLQNILWYGYRINAISVGITSMDEMLQGLLGGEGGRFYHDTITQDIIYCNNHYGQYFSQCFKCRLNSSFDFTCYRCSKAEHILSRIEQINSIVPGFIKNHKLIHFPFQPGARYHITKDDPGFHRGCCNFIRINGFGIIGVRSIERFLIRMRKAEPPPFYECGRGKKRHRVDLEHLLEHPISSTKWDPNQHAEVTENTQPLCKFMRHYVRR